MYISKGGRVGLLVLGFIPWLGDDVVGMGSWVRLRYEAEGEGMKQRMGLRLN